METQDISMLVVSVCMFKSYYVVWKLEGLHNDKNKMEEFKSYYVVWKRGCYNRNKGEC